MKDYSNHILCGVVALMAISFSIVLYEGKKIIVYSHEQDAEIRYLKKLERDNYNKVLRADSILAKYGK